MAGATGLEPETSAVKALGIPSGRKTGNPDRTPAMSCYVRIADLHVSHLSRKKHEIPGRAQESARRVVIRTFPFAVFASRLVVPALAEPDIHLLSKTPKSPHRRLSLCSLPVPKQSKRAFGVSSIAQSAICGTWQPAHRIILMFCHSTGSSYAAAVAANSSAATKSCFLRSTASI
jgi:hypothetical protein